MTHRTRILLGISCLAVFLHLPALAQDCTVGIKPPAPGSWVEYTSPEGSMRMAFLGNETRNGKSLMRMEMSMSGREGPMIMQMLVTGYPYDMASIEDFVMKAGRQPAMRISGQMRQMMTSRMPKDQIAEACRNARMNRVGEESITVPAGTFPTVHYHDANSNNDVWVSENIPFGLVKATLARGGQMVLTAKGTDAKSQITETPQEMQMPH